MAENKSLLSFDQVVKFDPQSSYMLIAMLVAASILVGLSIRLVKK